MDFVLEDWIRRPHKMFPMKIEDWSTIGVPLEVVLR